MTTDSFGDRLVFEVSNDVLQFESDGHISEWVQEGLPVQLRKKNGETVGFAVESADVPHATLVVAGRDYETAFPVNVLIGGLSGQVEIAGHIECVDLDGVCDSALADYLQDPLAPQPVAGAPEIGTKVSAMVRSACTGPSSDRFCIRGETNITDYFFFRRHSSSTQITSGGDWNSLAELTGGNTVISDNGGFGGQIKPLSPRTSRGPNARASNSRDWWFPTMTNIQKACASHLGHRRLLTAITEFTEENKIGSLGLQCDPVFTQLRRDDYPSQSLTCNGDLTQPILRCNIPDLAGESWRVSNQLRPEFDNRSSISFSCISGFNYNVQVRGAVGNNPNYTQAVVARCRATSR